MKKVFVAIILSLATSMAFVSYNPDKDKPRCDFARVLLRHRSDHQKQVIRTKANG